MNPRTLPASAVLTRGPRPSARVQLEVFDLGPVCVPGVGKGQLCRHAYTDRKGMSR
jgi:hypothetical protein